MEFSFSTKIVLESAVVIFGVLSVVYSYLGVYFGAIIGIFGAVLLCYEVRDRGIEKTDFRKKILHEALDGLHFVLDPNFRYISHGNWSSRTEESKTDLLGEREYALWNEFFDSIDARNQDFQTYALPPWDIFEKLNDRCVKSLLKIYSEISWVKEGGEAKTRIAAFKEKARETAGISESLRAELA
jgi:hypothetical protein